MIVPAIATAKLTSATNDDLEEARKQNLPVAQSYVIESESG